MEFRAFERASFEPFLELRFPHDGNRVSGATGDRRVVTSNGRRPPLRAIGEPAEAVAGARFKVWTPPSGPAPQRHPGNRRRAAGGACWGSPLIPGCVVRRRSEGARVPLSQSEHHSGRTMVQDQDSREAEIAARRACQQSGRRRSNARRAIRHQVFRHARARGSRQIEPGRFCPNGVSAAHVGSESFKDSLKIGAPLLGFLM